MTETIVANSSIQIQLGAIRSSLRAFALKLTGSSSDAEDLYQDTALRIIMHADKFNEGTNFKAWAVTIMRNIFINNYRKKSKANTIIDDTENLYYINTGGAAINNEAESNMILDELSGLIDSLDDSIKVPFMMHYQGFKYQEIADQLDLPLGTVKSRIFFARKELKDKLGNRYSDIHFSAEA